MTGLRDHGPPPDHWTPELVEARLVEALRWVRFTAGRVGPGAVRSAMPVYVPQLADYLEEGWGLPERAPDDDLEARPHMPGAEEISQLEAALSWVGAILAPRSVEMARAVNAVAFSKACAIPFSRIAKQRGISRATAYRLRDRGLSIISVHLDQEGVPPWPES